MKNEEMKKRIASEQQCARKITNDDMVCKDCKFRFDSSIRGGTSMCQKHDLKPNKVLLGDECDEYEQER